MCTDKFCGVFRTGFRSLKEVEIDKTECSTLLASIQKQQLVIPVVGNFSTGKSTLLNRFLEKSVLPTGITPETSLAT